MFGIVLWTDRNAQRVVIWCEDQGDLAFYDGRAAGPLPDTPPAVAMRAGDLVCVDLAAQGRPRRARSLRLVMPEADAQLPQRLTRAARQQGLRALP